MADECSKNADRFRSLPFPQRWIKQFCRRANNGRLELTETTIRKLCSERETLPMTFASALLRDKTFCCIFLGFVDMELLRISKCVWVGALPGLSTSGAQGLDVSETIPSRSICDSPPRPSWPLQRETKPPDGTLAAARSAPASRFSPLSLRALPPLASLPSSRPPRL
jgi:hypothetical protein